MLPTDLLGLFATISLSAEVGVSSPYSTLSEVFLIVAAKVKRYFPVTSAIYFVLAPPMFYSFLWLLFCRCYFFTIFFSLVFCFYSDS